MLLIWDLHITSKIKTELLDQIRAFVASHPEEKNLIFLGDFVYHFSYDRTALLELFEFFLELYSAWKNIYILTGNHDRLWNTFVFEEGKKVFDLLQNNQSNGKLHFITEPRLTEIEEEKILFLPFCLEIQEEKYPLFEQGKTLLTQELLLSKDKNEQFSGKLNQLVNAYIQQEKKLTIIHHYYFNKEKFSSYRSSFSFKDIALSEQLLDNTDVRCISGHLHAPFVHKNYLCTGSVWATSPLEVNQLKWCFSYSQGKYSFFWQQILNYLEVEESHKVEPQLLKSQFQQYALALKNNLSSSSFFNLDEFMVSDLDLARTVLTLRVEELNYDQIDELLVPELRKQLSDFRLKKNTKQVWDLLTQLEKPDESQLQTFGGWKELLKNFLEKQYPDEYQAYEAALKELKIL